MYAYLHPNLNLALWLSYSLLLFQSSSMKDHRYKRYLAMRLLLLFMALSSLCVAAQAALFGAQKNTAKNVKPYARKSQAPSRSQKQREKMSEETIIKKSQIHYRIKNPAATQTLPDFASLLEQAQFTTAAFTDTAFDDDYYHGDDYTSTNPYKLKTSSCYVPTTSTYFHYELELVNGTYVLEPKFITPQFCANYSQPISLPPPCIANESDLVYVQGEFSSDQSFYNCMYNVADPASAPNFYNGSFHGCLVVYTQITLLNLVKIDEIAGTANLQILVDHSWYDQRYAMPLFWEHVPPSYSGLDLTFILTNQSTVMWLPDVTFPDAQDATVQSSSLTLTSDNRFLYELAFDLTLVQPGFNFRAYPSDTQTLVIRYALLAYEALQLQLFPLGIYCSYLADGSCSFSENAIWNWDEDEDRCTVYYDQKASGNLIYPAYAAYRLNVSRDSKGIILRLLLPPTFLLLLSALTFWITSESRVDTTITLLLAVSALYIVILQSIPMVGYLTNVDTFVFQMFLLLCGVVSFHQIYATLEKKTHRWPLRVLYMRSIEAGGRVLLPSLIMFCFTSTIMAGQEGTVEVLVAALSVSAVVFSREFFGLFAAYEESLERLVEKVNSPHLKVKDLSRPEILLLNLSCLGLFTFSTERLSMELEKEGRLRRERKREVEVRHLSPFQRLLGGKGAAQKEETELGRRGQRAQPPHCRAADLPAAHWGRGGKAGGRAGSGERGKDK